MNEITYQNKVALNENPEIADINKVKASDMNEIKSVVNTNSQTSSNNFGLGTDTWTSSGTYSIGDIVVYNDNTYKNLTGTNTTTTPDQDSTNWEVIPLIVNEYNTSTKNAYSCDYANKAFGGTILWTNSNPTQAFSNQTITLDLSNYSSIAILYTPFYSNTLRQYSNKMLINYGGQLLGQWWISGTGDCFLMRVVTTSSNSVIFDNCNCFGIGTASTVVQNNECLIPIKIIGYKDA